MTDAPRPFSIVCFSSQEWHVDLPTNRQQIMSRVARRGHEVLFVETGFHLGRSFARLTYEQPRTSLMRRLFSTEHVAPGLQVRKAVNVAPWAQKYRISSLSNVRLTGALLRRKIKSLPQPVVVWIYDPNWAWSIGTYGEALAVYDCVDDHRERVGPDPRRRRRTAEADTRAASRARLVFTTTRPLYERHRQVNPNTHYVPNAGDYEHFAPAAQRSFAAPELISLPRPILGFAGNLLTSRVDFDLLHILAETRADATILLIGPANETSRSSVERLARRTNVLWLGLKTYAELPRYVAAFDVGLIPYVPGIDMKSAFPIKLYEYMAAGKPSVATGVPEVAGLEPDVVLADNAGEFLAAIEAALAATSDGDVARRMALAARNTWESRTERLLALITGELH